MTDSTSDLRSLASELSRMIDCDPSEAVRRARLIDLGSADRSGALSVRASVLVDAGAAAAIKDAVEEGLGLFRDLYKVSPSADVAYNVANALIALAGFVPSNGSWLTRKEHTRERRAEARKLYWQVAVDPSARNELRTQAWTNIANEFSRSYRLGEAHDARLAALAIDPSNGVAAGAAARDLLWLFELGGCSDLTRVEAIHLAKVAKKNRERVRALAGARAADEYTAIADQLDDCPPRAPHADPFVRWVESERLTLSPVVELVDPAMGKLDWLMLPGILERTADAHRGMPPPLFAMFNVMKADFILARDLAWRARRAAGWPATGRFADTLDYATYGPDASALVLAHRTALDLLDKIAVMANHYFELGEAPNKIYFGRLWRQTGGKKQQASPLAPKVESAIERGALALYGLTELAEDYEGGFLRPQKDLRNAGTHRFVVLHDLGDRSDVRAAVEVEHHDRDAFAGEIVRALRVARSALQMLALAITQSERAMVESLPGAIGTIDVPDHDWVRGREAT